MRIDRLLRSQLGQDVLVQLQELAQFDKDSEQDPGFAVVIPNPTDDEVRHLNALEVYLVNIG